MSKELDALERIRQDINAHNDYRNDFEDLKTIEQALQELQAIKSAEPSEALDYMKSLFECWKNLAEKNNLETKDIELEKYIFKENYDTIKQTLIKTQEQEKALKIIIKKNVRIYWIKSYSCVESYNNGLPPKEQLTKEEFNTLKEYLKC